jgi:hypothetical protein
LLSRSANTALRAILLPCISDITAKVVIQVLSPGKRAKKIALLALLIYINSSILSELAGPVCKKKLIFL